MSIKQISAVELCHQLAEGWMEKHPDAPCELVNRLSAHWQALIESKTASDSAFEAVFALDHLHLRGASALGCLVLGKGVKLIEELTRFWQHRGGGGRLTMVLAASAALKDAARKVAVPDGCCVFLGNGEIEALLTNSHSVELLKEHLRQQIPSRRLLPYDITHPVPSNMFFGRRDLLDRLRLEEAMSFAIAGPGRIGKSSILKQYSHELRRSTRDDRRHHLFLIDCYSYGHLDDQDLARRLALDISADSEANRVNASTLPRFLKRHSLDGQHPLELLFDEVDNVCQSETFEALAEAVRLNYCRVILCGRGNLYRMMKDGKHQFENRLELIRPEPLDPEAAKQLLFKPLGDLGILVEDEAALRQCVFDLSSRRPHFIQQCANLLFQMVETDQTRTLTGQHVSELRERFMPLSNATLPLNDMEDDLTRLITLLWLLEGGSAVTVGSLQSLAAKHGLTLDAAKILDICDQLWICNVLTWERGVLALASPHLVEFVRRMDFNKEIARLKDMVAAN